jgi:F-type H+-transporting ATPase subunit O
VKAPVHLFGIPGRYATALYSAGHKQKQLEQVEKDLKDLQTSIKSKGKLAEYFSNPSVQRNVKRDLIVSAMEKTSASKLTTNLLGLLAENGRLNKLGAIASAFSTIMSAHRGEVECEVTTAKVLLKK